MTSLWHPPPDSPKLGSDEVHVWRVSLDLPSAHLDRLRQTLAADERERADRFVFPKDRNHFVAARGALRAILGRYLGEAPGSLRFTYNVHGKPALDREPGGLRFNVSHSHGLAVIAVTHGRDVGVDVEHIQPDRADEQIARRFFSPREVAALLALPEDQQPEAFFTCWTRKEAFVKARGEGLSIPLDQFDVSLAPGEPATLLRANGDQVSRWSLHALDPGPDFAAALAVEGHGWRLSCWQWSGFD
jgi:4'-phosphopantetheinyl transferase